MDANDTLAEVDESLKQLRSLSNEVDERLRQRAAQPPIVLPSQAFLAKLTTQQAIAAQAAAAGPRYGSPPSKPADPLAALTGVASALQREHGPQGLGKIPPYASAVAAAASVAKLTGSAAAGGVGRGRLHASSAPVRDDVYAPSPQPMLRTARSTHAATVAVGHMPSPPRTAGPGTISSMVLAAGGTALGSVLALPGQLGYRELLCVAQASRAQEASVLQRELEGMDDEIDMYLAGERFERLVPEAAVAIQTAWRARGPRLQFNRYMAQRLRAQAHTLAAFFGPMRQLVAALRHQRRRLLAHCFQEWREIGDLKLELYRKVISRLKASMIDIRDSQSPNHLWRLCTAPGEGPWQATISLGALCKNLIQSQAPRRRMGMYFGAWWERVNAMRERRALAVGVLLRMEAGRVRTFLHMLFRFWYRWAIVRVAERLRIAPPLFRPRITEWDAWLWEHGRSRELGGRVQQLHRGFRMRHCFRFWHFFTERNRKMRMAWIGAAAQQIKQVMRYSLHCLMANWQEAKARRRMRANVFSAWRRVTLRNILVRTLSREVEANTRACIKRQTLRQMREWAAASRLLNLSATVQILQRRTLCMVPMFAWTGDLAHMWFVAVWNAWRNVAVGRLRFAALLGAHMQRMGALNAELAFKAWRKAAAASRSWREAILARNEARAIRRQERAAKLRAALKSGGSVAAAPLPDDSSSGSRASTPRGMALNAVSIEHYGGAEHGEEDAWENEEDEDPELPEESVHVAAGDYALPVPWRPVLARDTLMAANQLSTVGISTARIVRMVDELSDAEGRFKPGYGNDKQLVLEVVPRQEITEFQRQWADRDHPPSSVWQEQPGADPWLWQRVVGLVACAVNAHPEHAAGPMVDHEAMPWAEEVGGLRKRVLTERLRWACARDANNSDDDDGEEEQERMRGVRGRTAGLAARARSRGSTRGPQQQQHVLPAYVGLLPSEDQREVVWLWKLAVAEELLETSVAHMMGLGYKDLPALYKALEVKAGRAGRWATGLGPRMWQGDLLSWLLRAPATHDANFMAASATYRANRDRVITMGMELHERAMALNRHCPEFSLTYPEYDPTTKRDTAVTRVDEEGDEEASHQASGPGAMEPAQPPLTQLQQLQQQQVLLHQQQILLQQQQAAASGEGTPGWARRVGFSPPRLQLPQPESTAPAPQAGGKTPLGRTPKVAATPTGAAAFQRSATLSKSELIKMEMMGQLAPDTTQAVSPARAMTPPPATPPQAAAGQPPGSAQGSDRPGPQDMTSNPAKSLESVQASGVVLGAAAAAILAARAAAARMGGSGAQSAGASTARAARLMAQSSERKLVWRPGGHKRAAAVNGIGVDGSGLPEQRPPRQRRLPPVPMRAKSPSKKGDEDDDAGILGAMGAEASAGAEQGAAAFRAMMRAAQSAPASRPDTCVSIMQAASPSRLRSHAELEELMASTRRKDDAPPPPKPYIWFDGLGRIFPTVADVVVPLQPPSMAELHHRATKLLGEKLNSSIFSLPLMPASMFSDWSAADEHEGAAEHEAAPCTAPLVGSDPSAVPAAGLDATLITGSITAAAAPAHDLGPELSLAPAPQEASEVERTSPDVPPVRSLLTQESLQQSLDAERKAKLDVLMPGLGLGALLATAEEGDDEAPKSYRSGLGGSRYFERRTSDIGEDGDVAGLVEGEDHGNEVSSAGEEDEGADHAQLAAQVKARARRRAARAAAGSPLRTPVSVGLEGVGLGVSKPTSRAAGDKPKSSGQQSTTSSRRATREGGEHPVGPRGGHSAGGAGTSAGAAGAWSLERPREEEEEEEEVLPEGVREAVDRELAASPAPHTFTVTAQQLNIFLGGKLRGYKGNVVVGGPQRDTGHEEEEDAAVAAAAVAAAAAAAEEAAVAEAAVALAAEGDFETVFDAGRVVRPLSARRRELLDGYDLRAELADLMGGTAPMALAGAEAALLGLRNLSAAEEEAVRVELERLERELAAAQRRTRRAPRSPTAARSPDHGHSPDLRSPVRDGRVSPQRPVRFPQGEPLPPPPSQQALQPSARAMSQQSLPQCESSTIQHTASDEAAHQAELARNASITAVLSDVSSHALLPRATSHVQSQFEAGPQQEVLEPWGEDGPMLQHSHLTNPATALSIPAISQGTAPVRSSSSRTRSAHQASSQSQGPAVRPASGASISTAAAAVRPASGGSVSNWAGTGEGAEQASIGSFVVNGMLPGERSATPPSAQGVLQPGLVQPSSQTADATLIFPDRPGTGASFMSAASSTAAAQTLDDVYRAGSGGHQGFEVNVYNSLVHPAAGMLAEPELEAEGAPSLMFGGGRLGPGGRTRRKSNLRAAPPLFTPPLDGDELGGQPSAPPPLPPLPEGVDDESAAQLEALRDMWCSAPYSSAPMDPDSEAAVALSSMVAAAAEDEWRRYEDAAGRLVEELASALSRKDALETAARPGRVLPHGGAGSSGAVGGGEQQGGATKSQFGRALSLMESNLAAAIDPDRLTGLSMHTYDDRLSDLMSRLVVAPMATRYLFWKKVQSVQQLRQRVMEDRVLEEQLKGIAWAATFQAGHAPPPSGLLPPRAAAAHAEARPGAAQTGTPPGLRMPPGWSAGAASVITAPRQPWFTPLPGAPLVPATGARPLVPAGRVAAPMVTLPMKLRQREPPTRASPAPPLTGLNGQSQQAQRGTSPALITITPGSRSSSTAGDGAEPLFPPRGTEALAGRLLVLLERRRWQREVEAASGAGIRGLSLEELDAREEEVGRLAALTIKLHKEQLDRRNPLPGTRAATLVPGKGHVVGWREPHMPLPVGTTGRDGYQDTTDPYTVPPRARPAGPPGGGLQVTLHGAPATGVTARRLEAEQLARGLRGKGLSGSVTVSALPPERAGLPSLEELADHLPSPSGQGRPPRGVAVPPLAPIVPTPQYPSALEQLGNIGFVAPHEPHFVSVGTRLMDNSFQNTGPFTQSFSAAQKVGGDAKAACGSQGGATGGAGRASSGGPVEGGEMEQGSIIARPWSVASSSQHSIPSSMGMGAVGKAVGKLSNQPHTQVQSAGVEMD